MASKLDVRRCIGVTCVLCLVALAQLWAPQASFAVGLNRIDRRFVEQEIIPLASVGEPRTLLRKLAPFFARLDEVQQAEASQMLRNAGLPPIDQVLIQSRLDAVDSDSRSMPRVSFREKALLIEEILRSGDEVITLAQDRRKAISSIPNSDFLALEKVLGGVGLVYQRLATTSGYCEFVSNLNKNNGQVDSKALIALEERIRSAESALALSTAKARMRRLEYAAAELMSSKDEGQRLLAMIALNDDTTYFAPLMTGNGQWIASGQQMNEVEKQHLDEVKRLAPNLAFTARTAIQNSGPRLQQIAYHFSEGTRWWLRGRYGKGPMGGGLLKVPAAKGNPAILVQLMMPLNLDSGVSAHSADSQRGHANSQQENSGPVDRKHHYTWRWENRGIGVSRYYMACMKSPEEYGVVSEDQVFR